MRLVMSSKLFCTCSLEAQESWGCPVTENLRIVNPKRSVD